jgi:excisionase family DNA binding protein
MSTIEVRKVEPAALSPKGVCEYLSLSKRSVSTLIADQVLLAKRCGGRTLVDFASVKKFYEGLPPKTVAASIPNAPQSAAPSPRRRTALRTAKAVRS